MRMILDAEYEQLQADALRWRAQEAGAMCGCPVHGNWLAADDIMRNVKALDVALNGDKSATQAKLIDILAQVESEQRRLGRPVLQRVI